ncbi:MAG: type II toxin-antitoxin system RelE/ParE family toxin [Gemmataceae bacterium]|nr:type II toxin-antitoxin system RelE/ParE family toxin [Gemmataceae bacterium]
MKFDIVVDEDAKHELAQLKAFTQRKIAQAIDDQLTDEPDKGSKNRKVLKDVPADFEFEPPLWELRVGEYRVFYEVDRDRNQVQIRAIRRKPKDKRTKDILK